MKRLIITLAGICLCAASFGQLPADTLLSHLRRSGLATCRVDSVALTASGLELFLHPGIQRGALREGDLTAVRGELRAALGEAYADTPLSLLVYGRPLEYFVPNAYRDSLPREQGRSYDHTGAVVVRRLDAPCYTKGLSGITIAAWASHGWFYEPTLDRWEWQRARCFSTVEDISSTGYIHAYLTPMLERAGAEVFMPRERDPRPESVVVDNDGGNGRVRTKGRWKRAGEGYAYAPVIRGDENPFRRGTWLQHVIGRRKARSGVEYIPSLPAAGDYAVYATWGEGGEQCGKAIYEVRHTGGVTRFEVDQRFDGRTWYYLGTFRFEQGEHPATGSVRVSASPDCPEGAILTADAVRFGGGMGRVARGPEEQTSGMLAYAEGARYYLQGAGMPADVYSPTGFKSDYNDDYRSRGLWVNHLVHRMGIPVDISFAFHTDAGCTADSTIVGTLAIYSTYDGENDYMGSFPDGQPKIVNRDLADMVQTQITEDVRTLFDEQWTRRDLRDANYNEAWRPDVPCMLLELLSHQNLADMRYSLDPRFRFAVSRAIYKAMARFIASNQGRECVIQPLPPVHFSITPAGGKRVRLAWREQPDELEPTARAASYRLYTRVDEGGYDNGIPVQGTSVEIELPDWGRRVAFRVSAVNEGGESMSGEELSACLFPDQRPVLVVNGFTRVSAPLAFDEGDMAGLAWWEDEGVADGRDTHYVGRQYDFRRSSPWLDDDCPGWGASGSEGRNITVAGNSFDFPSVHGRALAALGRSYLSCSRAAFEDPSFDVQPYAAIDLILGEQRTTRSFRDKEPRFAVYTPAMMRQLTLAARLRTPLLVTGAYVGSDATIERDTAALNFMRQTLHYTQRNNISSQTGRVRAVEGARNGLLLPDCDFRTVAGAQEYRVEAPDAIEPAGEGAMRIYRYADTNMSAGVACDGAQRLVVLGFPFEAIAGERSRTEVMGAVMDFLLAK